MSKWNCVLSDKIYEAKRKYPILVQLQCSMGTVKKELNKNNPCCEKRKKKGR